MKKILILTFILVFLVAGTSFAAKSGVAVKVADEIAAEEGIVLDGFSDEWEVVIKTEAGAMVAVEPLDVLLVSALWMQWDADNLYFFVRVVDSALTAGNILYFWECDAVELWIDGLNAKTGAFNINCGQFWVTPVGGGEDLSEPTIGRWGRGADALNVAGVQHPDLWNGPVLTGTVPGMEVAINVDDIGYTLEIKIAASAIGLAGLEAGDVIGFNYMTTNLEVGTAGWAVDKTKVGDLDPCSVPSLWGEVTLIE